MENVLQTLAGQYTQQLALMMAAIAVAAFTVSVITEVTKEIGFLGRIPTAVQVIVLSVVLCPLSAGLLVVCDQHEGRGRVVGPGLGPGSGFLCGLPGHVRLGEAGAAVGKIQTSGRKRINDAVTIGMAATAVGTVLWFLVKMMIDDFKQSVSGVGSKLDSTIARFDERVTKLEDKQEADIKAVQKELSSIKGDFATTFVLREDFFRSMNGVEDKMRSMDGKLDRLLVRQGGKADG